MKVLSSQNSEYRLLDFITGKEKLYHVTSLKAFHFDPASVDPVDIARRDYLEFFVDRILEHQGNYRQPSSMTFLTKWVGYDDSHNTWEPWANLRRSLKLHEYLGSNNLSRIIPREFRQ